MNYEIINPPKAYRDPLKATKEESLEYWEWFLNSKEERIHQLENAVQTSQGFNNWKADFSKESLKELDRWLDSGVIENRIRTKEEIESIRSTLKEPYKKVLEISEWNLTNKSVSIGFDVGLYLGECLRNNYPKLKWDLFRSKAKYIDNNQPVLTGFFKISPYNPDEIGQVVVLKVADGRKSNLYDLYQIKVKRIEFSEDMSEHPYKPLPPYIQ